MDEEKYVHTCAVEISNQLKKVKYEKSLSLSFLPRLGEFIRRNSCHVGDLSCSEVHSMLISLQHGQ